MMLTVRNMEAGQAVEELEVDYDGEPFEIGFNARYLLDVTGQIGGEMAEFRFADPASPDPGARSDRRRRAVRADAAAGCMSRKVAAALAGVVGAANALQPARQRGKTVANLMAELERRATRTVETPHGPLDLPHQPRPPRRGRCRQLPRQRARDAGLDRHRHRRGRGAVGHRRRLRPVRALCRKARRPGHGVRAQGHLLRPPGRARGAERAGRAVTPLCLALSDKTGPTAIHLHGLDPGGALNTLQGSVNQFGETPSAFLQPVFAARMDDAVSLYALPQPDHVKLDVDGIEPWIVAGGPHAFARCKTVLIEVEGPRWRPPPRTSTRRSPPPGSSKTSSMRDRGSGRNRLFRRGDGNRRASATPGRRPGGAAPHLTLRPVAVAAAVAAGAGRAGPGRAPDRRVRRGRQLRLRHPHPAWRCACRAIRTRRSGPSGWSSRRSTSRALGGFTLQWLLGGAAVGFLWLVAAAGGGGRGCWRPSWAPRPPMP